jgi:hypothetical protein
MAIHSATHSHAKTSMQGKHMTKDQVRSTEEALDLALEFIEANHFGGPDAFELISAIKQARSQPAPVQELVAGQPLPCPFCGHIGLDFSDGETYRWGVASCGGCGASCGEVRREYPGKSGWHTEAIAEWNRRSPAAQRQWVGLTDEEISEAYNAASRKALYRMGTTREDVYEAIEAKLKEKNT